MRESIVNNNDIVYETDTLIITYMYEMEYAKKCLGKCCYVKTQEHSYL